MTRVLMRTSFLGPSLDRKGCGWQTCRCALEQVAASQPPSALALGLSLCFFWPPVVSQEG